MASVIQDDRAYRRGLVLGLTMAEIVILLIFCLLLALAAVLIAKDREIEAARAESAALRAEKIVLEDKLNIALAANPAADQFDDIFQELVQAREEIAALKHQNAALVEKAKAYEQIEQALKEAGRAPGPDQMRDLVSEIEALKDRTAELEAAQEVRDALESAGLPTDPDKLREALQADSESQEKLAQTEDQLKRLQDALTEAGLPTDPEELKQAVEEAVAARDTIREAGFASPQQAREALKDAASLKAENERLRARQAELEDGGDGVGKGTEMPSCWFDPATGKTEFIFDVALTSSGLIVRDRDAPPRQAAEKARLPIEITFDTELSPEAFLSQARPLFEWSVRNECRFFVRAFDRTAPHEKELFKQRLLTLEQRFYKLLVRGEPR